MNFPSLTQNPIHKSTGDTVYDVFAGVGPFALAASVSKHCRVLANDLNPDCVLYLRKNVKINKAKSVDVFNMCGSKFITDVCANDIKSMIAGNSGKIVIYFKINGVILCQNFE